MTDRNRTNDETDDDTLDGRFSRLISAAEDLCSQDEQRRDPLVEAAEARGLERAHAELAYDIALEERVPPALGIALVLEGVSVQPMNDARPAVGATESTKPGWVDTPPEPADADREWRLRHTFRRTRSLLETSATPHEALTALAREPDLETFDY